MSIPRFEVSIFQSMKFYKFMARGVFIATQTLIYISATREVLLLDIHGNLCRNSHETEIKIHPIPRVDWKCRS